jgi:hypothetical protein
MAFDLFKKKSKFDYPEEKASVLDEPPEGGPAPAFEPIQEFKPEEGAPVPPPPPIEPPALQPPAEPAPPAKGLGAGFRSPEEMKPPALPPPNVKEVMSASMEPPERPAKIMEDDLFRAPKPKFGTHPPHIYVRVTKYKEVMDAINELHRKIVSAKEDLEDLHDINNDESDKLKEAAEIVLKIEDLLRYLETTFTSPEM